MHVEGVGQGSRVWFPKPQRSKHSAVERAELDRFFAGFVPGEAKRGEGSRCRRREPVGY
ncbi:hypothetical protein SAMN02745121_03762 [Nannocystis exedens]|uniref:Uncharacterized protein n=1 Tax=Nannocystis exedens TaxID=54 RepID=A0A1I1ZGA8_9BACT|nr:hypothetical protein [Nannocystis exedens]PCC75033.1 hypothetical protein NAEX_08136 [Nannocystis exedens]SFE29593.1 hypothetical protein SAMN02745121_03762 [Nannocystis exedens]